MSSSSQTQLPNSNKRISAILQLDSNFSHLRERYYGTLTQDKASLFNFLLENNEIFNSIHPADEQKLQEQVNDYIAKTFNYTLGSFVGIQFIDQVIMRFMFPQVVFPIYPGLFRIAKYIGIPAATYMICKPYFKKQVEDSFSQAVEKYNFGKQDYNNAMDFLEKAYHEQRLHELFMRRKYFDWSSIPGGKPHSEPVPEPVQTQSPAPEK